MNCGPLSDVSGEIYSQVLNAGAQKINQLGTLRATVLASP